MGSCSKKPVRTDVRPDKTLYTEEPIPAKRDLPAQSRSPGAKYVVEEAAEPEELIRHYENQADLLSRYQLPAEKKEVEGRKKKSMIVFAQRAPVPMAEKEESSFESSGSVAEGVVGTVH